jgi:LysM repeat protein
MKENTQQHKKKERIKVEPKPNNNLLVVLAVLVLVIIGLVIYAASPGKAPSSLVDEAQYQQSATEVDESSAPTDEAGKEIKPKAAKAINTSVNTINATSPVGAREHIHTVKPRETLFSITQRYNMPQKDFKALNGLASDKLRVNQQVKVRIKAIHEVGAGESISAIADKYQIKKPLILKANALQDERVHQYQKLIIPLP